MKKRGICKLNKIRRYPLLDVDINDELLQDFTVNTNDKLDVVGEALIHGSRIDSFTTLLRLSFTELKPVSSTILLHISSNTLHQPYFLV